MKLLKLAISLSTSGKHRGKFRLGAVAVRADGCTVTAINGGCPKQRSPSAHAEARLSRKLTQGAVVYVARTLQDGTIAMARPCRLCQNTMRNRGVKRVVYTISSDEYGVMNF